MPKTPTRVIPDPTRGWVEYSTVVDKVKHWRCLQELWRDPSVDLPKLDRLNALTSPFEHVFDPERPDDNKHGIGNKNLTLFCFSCM